MRNFALILAIIALIGPGSSGLKAQIEMGPSVIASSGGFGESEDFSISWTLGEIAVSTLKTENLILNQGFQQASDFGLGIQKNDLNWDISVYPNPVQNELSILFDLRESNDFLLELQDVTGRLLIQESHERVIPGDLVILNISDFVSGVYFLRVFTTDFKQVKVACLRKL